MPPPAHDFLHTTLGRTGLRVFRLGLSGTYRPGERALREGIDAGMNYLLWYWTDTQMTRTLRDVLPGRRERFVVVTGTMLQAEWLLRRALEGALRRLRTDYLDLFHVFWVGEGRLASATIERLSRFREEGKIRGIAVSTHVRRYAAELLRRGVLDALMMRYNAAHRGAEQEIFPYLGAAPPGVISYTATRWGFLLRRPRGWPASEPLPTAGDCYRFVLSHPQVDVCLTAPRSLRELRENLAAAAEGPLPAERRAFLCRFGDAVHRAHRFFL